MPISGSCCCAPYTSRSPGAPEVGPVRGIVILMALAASKRDDAHELLPDVVKRAHQSGRQHAAVEHATINA